MKANIITELNSGKRLTLTPESSEEAFRLGLWLGKNDLNNNLEKTLVVDLSCINIK